MANKIEIQQPLIDASIVVGGGGLINTLLIGNVAQLQALMANLPVIQGINTAMIVTGAAALIAVKFFMKK